MALSGSFSQTFGTYYRLQLEWTATQDVSANTSTITAKLYLISLGSGASISSGASKTFRITIDGVASATTGNLNLSGGQKKLLHTYSRTVAHGSDGTKSVPISGYMQWGLNVNGHTSDVTISKTEVLTPISRGSTIASVGRWRAGESTTITINRASSAYTHTVRLYIGTTLVATRTGVGSSATFNFTGAEFDKIFAVIGRASEAPTRVEVDTYSGSSRVGSTATATGAVAAAIPSTAQYSILFSGMVGDPIALDILMNDSKMNHTAILRDKSGTELARGESNPGVSYIEIPTSGIVNQLHNLIGTAKSIVLPVELYTKYDAQVIRDPYELDVELRPNVEESEPEFSPFGIYHTEADPAVIAFKNAYMGTIWNSLYLAGESRVEIVIPEWALAKPKGTARITQYRFSLGTATKTVNVTGTESNVSAVLPGITATGSMQASVTARDSNGRETTVLTDYIKIVPYTAPTAAMTATRVGRFENETTVKFTNSISPIMDGSSSVNGVVTRRYRTRQQYGVWGGWTSLPLSGTNNTVTLNLDNTKTWEIQFEFADRLKTVTRTATVSAGKPTFFLDSQLNSVGVNKFPTRSNALEVDGILYATAASFDNVQIGMVNGDLWKQYARMFVNTAGDKMDFMNGGVRMEMYSSDVSFYTSRGKFWFGNSVEIPYGLTANGPTTLSEVTVNGTMKFNREPVQSVSETGYCGFQTDFTSAVGFGYSVNFRVKKDYVPTSVSLSRDSGNLATSSLFTGYISQDGFWMQVVRSNASANTAWRGTYTA